MHIYHTITNIVIIIVVVIIIIIIIMVTPIPSSLALVTNACA